MNPVVSFSGLASGIQWRDLIDQIMQLEASRKVTPLTNRVSQAEARIKAWSDFQNLASKLKTASTALKDGSAFGQFAATATTGPSGRALISATASSTATPGAYKLEVIELARAEKLGGAAVANTADALSLNGQFFVNGRAVDVVAGDSLSAIRDKINAANFGSNASGVTATILSTSSTSHSLVLTSDQTGSRGIELVDSASSGGVLQSLGVLDGTKGANTAPADSGKTQSQRFESTSSSLASMLGVTAPPATTTIMVDGKKVTVDLVNDTLVSLMNKIATAGGTATTVEETVGSTKMYRLQASGSVAYDPGAVLADGTTPATAESQRIIELLGFTRSGRVNEITTGSDARFQIDDFLMTRRANTVTDAIAGVTLNLLASDAAQRTSTLQNAATGLSIARDPKSIDPGSYGISLSVTDTTGRSAIGTGSISSASASNSVAPGTFAVESVVTRTAGITGPLSPYLSAVAAPSTVAADTDYAISITQAATRGTATGKTAGDYSGITGDYFSIVDNVTGITGRYELTAGQTLDAVVLGLNDMFASEGMKLSAVNDGGKLKLEHSDYGTAGSFTVATVGTKVPTHYGIGSAAGTTYTGTDVAGLIDGQLATGQGQVLTAGTGSTVAGLAIKYTGTILDVATIRLTDTVTGKLGGHDADYDAATQTFTGKAGTPVEGLAATHATGTFGPASLGSPTITTEGTVEVTETGGTSISGVTIGGVAATWDDTSKIIRGVAGTEFEGLELSYTGAATSGSIGDLVIEGDIAVDLTIERDLDAIVTKVQEFADAYTALDAFTRKQNDSQGPLASSGALRSSMRSLTDVLLTEVVGQTIFKRGVEAGVALSKSGTLEVDTERLREVLVSNPSEVQALFEGIGDSIYGQTDVMTRTGDGTLTTQIDSLNAAIETLNQRTLAAERRLEVRRGVLERQFMAMESALSQMQSQSSWLSGQFASLQGLR